MARKKIAKKAAKKAATKATRKKTVARKTAGRGRALVNYPSNEVVRILGRKSGEIVKILGCCEYEEVVHRDNLVLI